MLYRRGQTKTNQRRAAIPRDDSKNKVVNVSIGRRRLVGLCRLLQKFFCFVDLCGEIGAAAAIGVVQEHEPTVLLADDVAGEAAFSVVGSPVNSCVCFPEASG
jgi:hypothetical protein